MKTVIDSNVWISALIFGGRPRQVFESVVRNGWTLVLSEEIITEVRRIIKKKFANFVDDFETFLLIMGPYISVVKIGESKVFICRDNDDNQVIETAVAGVADFILTGDKDLLVLGKYNQIIITDSSSFIALSNK